tara:strand:- start:2577 stop:3323 length:747 start_codon:yes stop_codon:yes gene_type:complete
MTGTVAITMAGMGSRFTQAGYNLPKYEITALGRPLFDWSMLSLDAFRVAGWQFCFAVRAGVGAPAFIRDRAAVLDLKVADILTLDGATDGQATTARMLAEKAPQDAPFAIYNIDTFVAPGAMVPPVPTQCAGWIPCFPAPGEGWSFARTDLTGRVVELREKKRISDHATIGLYWFDRADRYLDAYHAYFSVAGREEKGERYVAPLYNQLISEGANVQISDIALSQVGMLGTPDQVADFVANQPDCAIL